MKNFLAQRRKGAKALHCAAGLSENLSHSVLRNHWTDQAAIPQLLQHASDPYLALPESTYKIHKWFVLRQGIET